MEMGLSSTLNSRIPHAVYRITRIWNRGLSVGVHVRGCGMRLAVKNSIAIVLVGVLPCTQLADAACKCGLRLAVVFGQGSTFKVRELLTFVF